MVIDTSDVWFRSTALTSRHLRNVVAHEHGHGLGLEINEPPFLARGLVAPLEAGNVIAVEPKLVFPGLGAVGIENTYLVRPSGPPERLTAS